MMVHSFFVEESDSSQHEKRRTSHMCPFLLTSLLCPHFPLSPDASWLAVGVSCAAPDAAKYPSNFC